MKTKSLYFLGLILALTASSCKDELYEPIIGKWNGDKAEFDVKPSGFPVGIRYTLDNFTTTLDFKTDGRLTITEKGNSTTGTYDLKGKKLAINIDFNVNDINLGGTYIIKELTKSALVIEIEKEDTVKNPETNSNVSGKVKATLFFDRTIQ